MNNIKLSIIIPVFNNSLIKDALKSIRNYKTDSFEVIVVDGNSNDGTLEIINQNRDIVDTLISEPDNGPYDAANKGIKKARGEWIFWFAADDMLLVDPVSIIDKYKSEKPDVICGSIIEEKSGNKCKKVPSDKNTKKLDFHCSLRQPASFFKRKVLLDVGLYDTSYRFAADRDLFIKIRNKGYEFLIIEDVIVRFRYGGLTTSSHVIDSYCEDYQMSLKYGASRLFSLLYYYFRCTKYKIKTIIRN